MDSTVLMVMMISGACFSAGVAATKRRNFVGWLVLGALMPLIAVVAICSFPANDERNPDRLPA